MGLKPVTELGSARSVSSNQVAIGLENDVHLGNVDRANANPHPHPQLTS